MANVNLHDIMLVTVRGRCFNQRFMLTHTLACQVVTGVQAPITAQLDVIDKLKAGGTLDIVTPYAQCLNTSCNIDLITAQILTSERMRESKLVQDVDGSAGAAEVCNLATALTFITQRSGRGQIANKHIGPLATGTGETLIVDGVLTDAYKDEIDDLGTAMLGNPSTNAGNASWSPCIVHRSTDPVEIEGYTLIDSYFYRGIVSSQRTRVIGKGE